MSRFRLVAQGVNVSGVCAELKAQPGLWNAHTGRTERGDSPHHGVRDIWLRWRSDGLTDPSEHWSVDLPAWRALPSLHLIVRNLSQLVDARFRGGILITETPPGGEVRMHVDSGWHAEFYDTKLYLTLQSDPRCLVHCDGEEANFREGDVWTYPNNVPHGVVNAGRVAHRNVILCFRTI